MFVFISNVSLKVLLDLISEDIIKKSGAGSRRSTELHGCISFLIGLKILEKMIEHCLLSLGKMRHCGYLEYLQGSYWSRILIEYCLGLL